MDIRPRRSLLYMPGTNARAHEKARTLPADGLIFDLEDSVAPEEKQNARDRISETVKGGGFGAREIAARINGLESTFWRDDLAGLAALPLDALVLPKVSGAKDIAIVSAAMRETGFTARTRLWVMIETPRAVLDIAAIAACADDKTSPLSLFILGTNDIARETHARMVKGRAPMLSWISQCVLAARAYGLSILDSVYNDIKDIEGFRAECEQGRDLGMDGKTLIHPGQIAPANEIFAPPAHEIEDAQKIVAAFELPENAAKGVINLGGRMVERLHLEMARRILSVAAAISSAASSAG